MLVTTGTHSCLYVDTFAIHLYMHAHQQPTHHRHRCTKVLTHETGHLFGIRHCIHYECLMCGCNHREEFDRHPIHLCPVCLRKLCIKRTKG